MTSILTPWADFVTPIPLYYSYKADATRVHMTAKAGKRRTAICELDLQTLTLFQGTTFGNLEEVEPYRLQLQPWKGSVPPVTMAHPFLLLHLMATGQAELHELKERATGMGRDMTRTTITICQPCSLLTMLHTQQLGLMLSTVYDLR